MTAQQLVRYDALFALLGDIQGEDIAGTARQVARQWKYAANVANWRLVVYDEHDYLVIDGMQGRSVITETDISGLSDWDARAFKEAIPGLYHLEDLSGSPEPPCHLLEDYTGQVQVMPIFSKNACIAVLTVSSRNKPFDDLDNRYIRLLAHYFADRVLSLMLQNRALQVLRTKATRDALTGLLNRGAVMEHFDAALAMGRRSSHSVCVLLADIDHFKDINDTWGHQAGDRILVECAARLEEAARESDSLGRYGGEEFLIILNKCSLSQAGFVAERFRKSISARPFAIEAPDRKTINVTISIGASCSETRAGYNQAELIRLADHALYDSKKNGRDRVTVAD